MWLPFPIACWKRFQKGSTGWRVDVKHWRTRTHDCATEAMVSRPESPTHQPRACAALCETLRDCKASLRKFRLVSHHWLSRAGSHDLPPLFAVDNTQPLSDFFEVAPSLPGVVSPHTESSGCVRAPRWQGLVRAGVRRVGPIDPASPHWWVTKVRWSESPHYCPNANWA